MHPCIGSDGLFIPELWIILHQAPQWSHVNVMGAEGMTGLTGGLGGERITHVPRSIVIRMEGIQSTLKLPVVHPMALK